MYDCVVGLSDGATLDEQSYRHETKLFDLRFDFHYREGEAVLVLGGITEGFTVKCELMERYLGVRSKDEQRGILSAAVQAIIRLVSLDDLIPPEAHRLSLLLRRSSAAWLGLQGKQVGAGDDPLIEVAGCEPAR